METLSISTEEELYCFLEEHGDNRVKREILSFLGRHPNTRFARYVICRALDYGKLEVDRALSALVEESLVDNHASNGLTLYSLTPARRSASRCWNWRRWAGTGGSLCSGA